MSQNQGAQQRVVVDEALQQFKGDGGHQALSDWAWQVYPGDIGADAGALSARLNLPEVLPVSGWRDQLTTQTRSHNNAADSFDRIFTRSAAISRAAFRLFEEAA